MLTREQILAANDLPIERVSVPEWGGSVCIRTLTAAQREEWEKQAGDAKGKWQIRATLVAAAVCDEAGKPLFTANDVAALAAKSAPPIIRIFEAANKQSGISEEDVAELEKNSEANPSDSSASGSHAN